MIVLVLVAQLMKIDPQSIGVLPDGERGFTLESETSPTGTTSGSSRDTLRSRQFWIICFIEFAVFFCLLTVTVHIVPHALDLGLSPSQAALILSIIGAVSVAGRLTIGTLIDRISGKRSLIVCFSILISSLIWLQFAAGTWMLFLFAVVYGFAHGGFFTVMSPLVAESFGTDSLGQLFGTVLFVGTLGGTIGPTASGLIFDATNSYQAPFLILTGIVCIGLIMAFLLKSGQNSTSP